MKIFFVYNCYYLFDELCGENKQFDTSIRRLFAPHTLVLPIQKFKGNNTTQIRNPVQNK